MGWQDAPEVSAPSAWASAPVMELPAKSLQQQFAETVPAISKDRDNAFTIGAGRTGAWLTEGLKQGGLGIGAILSELLPARLKAAAQEEITKKLSAQKQTWEDDTKSYKTLEDAHPVATGLGEAAPLAMFPMVRLAEGAGAGAAALNSGVSAALPSLLGYGDAGERLKAGALSAAGGALGSGLASGAAKVISGVKNVLTPEAQRLAALAAEKYGIPLDAAAKTGNKALQTVNAAMENMPITSGVEAAKKNAIRQAFTREVMKTLGETTEEATPATFGAAKARMGGEFERIFNKVNVNLDDKGVQEGLGKVVQNAVDTLPPDQARIVAKRTSDLFSKIGEDGSIAGKAYQAWRSDIQSQATKTSDEWLATHLRDLYRVVDQAAYKSAAEAGEEGALKTVRGQYRNMKTIEPLVAKAENGTISPSLLRGAVMQHTPDYATGGGSDLGELARIGRLFVSDQVPNSGTAQRAMAQTLLTGGIGGATWATTGDPNMAMKAGMGTLAGTVLLPKAAQMALNSRPVQRYLGSEHTLDPVLQALMDRSAKLGTLGGARALAE